MDISVQPLCDSIDVETAWRRILTPPPRPLSKQQRRKNPQGIAIVLVPEGGAASQDALNNALHHGEKLNNFGIAYATRSPKLFVDMCKKFIENNGGRDGISYRFVVLGEHGRAADSRAFADISWMDASDLCRFGGL